MHTAHPILEPFLRYLQFEKRYSPHTVLAYQTDLISFFDFLQTDFSGIELAGIGHTHVRTWLADLKNDENTKARTLNRKISSLKAFFRYQVKTGVLQRSPMGKIIAPKTEKRLPQFVAQKDMEKLFEKVVFPDDWNGKTDRLLLLLFYHTGIRLSEALGLKTTSVDAANNNIKVLGKGGKERIIPVSLSLLQTIQDYEHSKVNEFSETVAPNLLLTIKGKALSARNAYQRVHTYLSAVTTIEKRSPHVLRHTFATHLTNNGADLNAVKELLGHSSLAATQVYTHNTIDKLKDIYRKAHPKA